MLGPRCLCPGAEHSLKGSAAEALAPAHTSSHVEIRYYSLAHGPGKMRLKETWIIYAGEKSFLEERVFDSYKQTKRPSIRLQKIAL